MIDLSGRWTGSYAYSGRLDPVPFSIDLRDDGGLVSGLIEEDGSGIGLSGLIHSTCAGQHDGKQLSFTKIYDTHEMLIEPIAYQGRILDDGHEISGTWSIAIDQMSGPFVMTRPKASTEEEQAVASLTV